MIAANGMDYSLSYSADSLFENIPSIFLDAVVGFWRLAINARMRPRESGRFEVGLAATSQSCENGTEQRGFVSGDELTVMIYLGSKVHI